MHSNQLQTAPAPLMENTTESIEETHLSFLEEVVLSRVSAVRRAERDTGRLNDEIPAASEARRKFVEEI